MKNLINISMIGILVLSLMSCGGNDAPEVNLTEPTDGTILTAADTLTIRGVATDDVAVTNVTLSSSQLDIDGSNLASTIGMEVPFGAGLTLVGVAAGTYDITVTATDEEGDTGTASATFEIQ